LNWTDIDQAVEKHSLVELVEHHVGPIAVTMKGLLAACTLVLLCQLGIGERLCPCGWERRGKSCYFFSSEKKSWTDAQQACRNMHPKASLVEITDSGENDFVKNELNGKHAWIGGTDAYAEGSFFWIGSFTPMTFANWRDGEPNNTGGDENCVMFYGDGQWNDGSYFDQLVFVCKM
ncbi:hypothetical protein BaRGS_00003700, partial [Batillaria attramentaria]